MHLVARDDAVLLRQEFHREMDARQIATRHRKIARRFGPARQDDRGVLGKEGFRRHILADVHARPEFDALDGHLRHAAIDQVPLHLEVGNAVAEEAANAIGLLVEDDVVARARELLRARESGRPGTHDRNSLARFSRPAAAARPSPLPIPCR